LVSRRKRILVADSDEIVSTLISHVLRRQGYEVDVAESVETLDSSQYDAAVLDANLTEVKADAPSVVILGTSNGHSRLTAQAVIRKPVEFGELLEALGRMLE